MHINVPNVLTLLRIALIPIFVLFFYLPLTWAYQASTVIFATAAITDWLDGYLARKLSQTSKFGEFLDPVADKLMVACALVMLVDNNPTQFAGLLMAIPAGIIIGREIVISALREWMAELGERAQVAVSVIGKIKTTVQMVALLLLLYRHPLADLPTAEIGFVLLYVAAVLTLWSMIIYIRAAWPIMNNHDTK
jgi:CDP-diacylglycerol--glycerol-3-phosphate 3-phosphatidyltransferase